MPHSSLSLSDMPCPHTTRSFAVTGCRFCRHSTINPRRNKHCTGPTRDGSTNGRLQRKNKVSSARNRERWRPGFGVPCAWAVILGAMEASVNGIEMYYETHGEGEPLVLLHGF